MKFKDIKTKIVEDFFAFTKGLGSYNKLLFLWGCFPGFFFAFIFIKKISNFILPVKFLLSIIIMIYFIWHIYAIYKTLKEQPQYKKKKISKKELYKDKTEEEIKKIKRENLKIKAQKLVLIKPWDTSPTHTWVVCLDLYVILTYLNVIIN